MLTDITGWTNDLSLADVVVFQEDNLQKVANVLIGVDHSADLVDEMDDSLGHPVSWSCFATEDADSRLDLLSLRRRHIFKLEVSVDNAEYVELLPLVLVDTLDLDIEQAGWVHLERKAKLVSKQVFFNFS